MKKSSQYEMIFIVNLLAIVLTITPRVLFPCLFHQNGHANTLKENYLVFA